MRSWIILALLHASASIFGNTPTESYVSAYAPLAVCLSLQSGVPASIVIAQGILESDRGRSRLFRTDNNSFGVKCWRQCNNDKHCRRYGKHGRFVRYKSVDESFRHHNRILSKGRYSVLIGCDYKDWAKGLKALGYASDKRYAEKLISIIEKYSLYEHDFDAAQQSACSEKRLERYAVRLGSCR